MTARSVHTLARTAGAPGPSLPGRGRAGWPALAGPGQAGVGGTSPHRGYPSVPSKAGGMAHASPRHGSDSRPPRATRVTGGLARAVTRLSAHPGSPACATAGHRVWPDLWSSLRSSAPGQPFLLEPGPPVTSNPATQKAPCAPPSVPSSRILGGRARAASPGTALPRPSPRPLQVKLSAAASEKAPTLAGCSGPVCAQAEASGAPSWGSCSHQRWEKQQPGTRLPPRHF